MAGTSRHSIEELNRIAAGGVRKKDWRTLWLPLHFTTKERLEAIFQLSKSNDPKAQLFIKELDISNFFKLSIDETCFKCDGSGSVTDYENFIGINQVLAPCTVLTHAQCAKEEA